MQVRKPTEIKRAVLSQELRLVLDKEADALPGTYRKVHVFTPPSPRIHISIDQPTPNEAGPDRDYRTAAVGTDIVLRFVLQPQQKLFAQVEQGGGYGIAAVLVEYLEGGD